MTRSGRLNIMRALLILVLLGGTAAADVLKEGDHAAELDVAKDAAGKAWKLKNLKDSWVVITIGAEWCKPCAKELPTWDKLAGEFKGKVTFVALDIDNDPADGARFHKKLKLKNMTLVYLPAEKSAVVGSYGEDTMPTTFVIDPKGIVRFVKKTFDDRDAAGEVKKFKEKLTSLTTPPKS
jgi:thiol-disulfide isomerase/thioredoxin